MLGTMYETAWPLLEAIAPQIRGKGKMILDMTNPFLKRPDGYGAGLPKDGPQPKRHPSVRLAAHRAPLRIARRRASLACIAHVLARAQSAQLRP